MFNTDMPFIYIFAGGDNERWEYDYSKEIATVNRMPIIVRTIYQIRGLLRVDPIVVTHKEDVIDVVIETKTPIMNSKHGCLIESIRNQTWGLKNAILLGDVHYSDMAIDNIFRNWSFAYGNETDIFALRWVKPDVEIQHAFLMAYQHWQTGGGRGKLWEAFRAFHQKPLDEHWLGGSLFLIEDETTDFDNVQWYEEWLVKHNKEK